MADYDLRSAAMRIIENLAFAVMTWAVLWCSAGCRQQPERQPLDSPVEVKPMDSFEPPSPPAKPTYVQWEPGSVGMEDWLSIASQKAEAPVAWLTGRIMPKDNRLEIQTEGVERLVIDLDRLNLDWSRRVVLCVDDQVTELIRGDSHQRELELSPAGRWIRARIPAPDPAPTDAH